MKKVIAIAFSDLHLNMWSKFNNNNSRTINGFDILSRIAKLCEKYNCPSLFCGDLLHKPENINQELAQIYRIESKKLSIKYPRFICYAINGNHDLSKINSPNSRQLGWVNFLEEFGWLKCIDWKTIKEHSFTISGIPYIDHNNGINEYIKTIKSDILLLHTDYPGAKDTDGRLIDSVENLNINLLKPFKLILIGHIHKYQRLGKKVYIVGAPQQQRRTDRNCKMGYLKIYDDFSVKFKPFKGYPEFIDVYDETDIKDDGNYYTVIPKPTSKLVESEHKITKQLTKKQLARRYMKQKGDKDRTKLKLLTRVLMKGEELC